MSVEHGLLALLERGTRYGYQLRTEFEHATGGTWPLNIGQVYTTLSRLERDGLVRALPESDGGQRPYEITDDGPGRARAVVRHPDRARPTGRATSWRSSWRWRSPRPGVDVRAVVQTQRTATHAARCRSYTRLKAADRRRATWPGGWCWRRWSSRPRPRCAGSTTARPTLARYARPTRHNRTDAAHQGPRRPRRTPRRRGAKTDLSMLELRDVHRTHGKGDDRGPRAARRHADRRARASWSR